MKEISTQTSRRCTLSCCAMKDWVAKQLEDPEFRKDFEEELCKQQADESPENPCDDEYLRSISS